MQFIRREITPQQIEIAGSKYPAILSYEALAITEEITEMPHVYTLARFMMDAPTGRDVTGLLYGAMKAAGVEVEHDDIASSLHVKDHLAIVEQLKKLIQDQGPDMSPDEKSTESKNAKTPK